MSYLDNWYFFVIIYNMINWKADNRSETAFGNQPLGTPINQEVEST